MGRLDGKVAVVTGGGRGVGQAMCMRFAEEGATIICPDIDEAAAAATVKAVTASGKTDAMAWVCDVADSTGIESMFEAATSQHGVVNVLVSCAGVDHTPGDGSGEGNTGTDAQVAVMSNDGWQRMLDIHLNGAFYCTR